MTAHTLKKSLLALAAVAATTASPFAHAESADCGGFSDVVDQCYFGFVARPAAAASFADESIGDLALASASSLVGKFMTPYLTLSSISLWSGGTAVATDSNIADGISFAGISAGDYTVTISGLLTGPKVFGYKLGGYAGGFAITPSVPEPETYALFGAGLLAVFFMSRRRNNA